MIDLQVISAASDGDRKAQYLLYKACYDILFGVCLRYLKDEDDAVEMMNQGFMKILTNLGSYKTHIAFEAWIKRIMINVLIDDFRKNNKHKQSTRYTDFSEGPQQNIMHDTNTYEQDIDVQEIQRYINMLPDLTQKVLNLFAIDGYTHVEISKMLGISEGTSKWHLYKARKHMQEMMLKYSQKKINILNQQ